MASMFVNISVTVSRMTCHRLHNLTVSTHGEQKKKTTISENDKQKSKYFVKINQQKLIAHTHNGIIAKQYG